MTAVAGRFPNEFRDSNEIVGATNLLAEPTGLATSNKSSFCVGCGAAIRDPVILHVQPNLEWHGRCLNCFKCHRSLGNDPTCFVREGKAYCREDYFNTFYCRCAGCHEVVSRSELVYRVRSTAFHMACLRCAICERLLQPGEEIAFQNDQICCITHTWLLGLGSCSVSAEERMQLIPPGESFNVTNRSASGRFKLGEDQVMSSECLLLGNSPEFTDSGNAREELHSLSSLHCRIEAKSAADKLEELQAIGEYRTESVKRKTVELSRLSLNPTSCNSGNPVTLVSRQPKQRDSDAPDSFGSSPHCGANTPGSSIGEAIRDTDTPLTASSELSHGDASSSLLGLSNSASGFTDPGPNLTDNALGSLGSDTCLGHRLRNVHAGLLEGSRTGSGSSSSGTSQTGGCGEDAVPSASAVRIRNFRSSKMGGSKRCKDQKTTRVRTVLNEKQLHTLRTCYAANPRPDALMKEQLVEMTSLSPRVIRVWFQNKRCKDKKRQILLKQIEQHQQNGGRSASLHGIPMVAGSPVCNDSVLINSTSGIDIQQLPGPYWKQTTTREINHRVMPQCPTFTSGSPYNPGTGCKLTENASPAPSSMIGTACDTSTSYVFGMVGNLVTSFTPIDAPAANNSPLTILPPGSTPVSTSTARSRFGFVGLQSGMQPVSGQFIGRATTAQTSIPAFQQLVSSYDPTEGGLVSLPNQSPTHASKRLSNRDYSDGLGGALYAAEVSAPMPQNVSIAPLIEKVQTKLCSPFKESVTQTQLFPPTQADLPPFSSARNYTQPVVQMVNSSPSSSPVNLLPSSSVPLTSNLSVGAYLQGQIPQLQLGSQARTSLST